jgi:predicted chitinase
LSDRFQPLTETAAAPTSTEPLSTGLLQRKCACGAGAGLGGSCSDCDSKRLSIQRHAVSQQAAPAAAPPAVQEVLRSSGEPLDAETQALMETRLGHDFSRVRVHTDARAAESASAVDATAYTVGQQVVFGAGKYRPRDGEGRRLLAHELTHVVQQSGAGGAGGHTSEAPLEAEADRNAEAVNNARPVGVRLRAGAGAIQRQSAEARDEEVEKILGAATRAKATPEDRTSMLVRGSSITYRLIGKYLRGYSGRLSGVSYDEKVAGVLAQKSGRENISVTVGKDFILGTTAGTLKAQVAQLEAALKATGVAPLPEVASPEAAPAAQQPAIPDPVIAQQAGWGAAYGPNPKTYVGESYEDYKAGIGELRPTTEGGVKGKPGRGTPAAPSITFEVLKKAYPGFAKDVEANPAREKQGRAYLDSLNQAFKLLKIDTVEAQANYLAHAYVESDQFRQFIETQGWLNNAEDPAKRLDQKWITDPSKLRLDKNYLEKTYNPKIPTGPERNEEKWVTARRRKGSVNPGGKFEFIGRGPVQVTHNYHYMEVVAMLEVSVEHYEQEAKDATDEKARREALEYAAFAREAANAVRQDPNEAANPKYTFLFSAASMKKKNADVNVAGLGSGAEWTGGDLKSSWVAGAVQTEKPQKAALKEKKGAYNKILPLLMCEAKKAGVNVDPKYGC